MADVEKKLLFVIGAQTKDFNRAIGDVDRQFKSTMGNITKAFGALLPALSVGAVVAGFTDILASAANLGDGLDEMAQRTGVGTTALQKFSFAAKVSGASIEDVETGIKKMQVAITNASQGSQPAIEIFKRLNIPLADLKLMSPEQQFSAIAAAISKIEDPTLRAATAVEIFGKSGTSLLPMITSLDELTAKAERLGIILSEEQVQSAAKAQDAFDTLGIAWEGLKNQFATTILPNLTPLIESLTTMIGWINQARSALQSLSAATSGISSIVLDILAPQWSLFNPRVPKTAAGGIVTSPQVRMVGEAGPEAIIPLSQGGIGGSNITVNLSAGAFMGSESDARQFAKMIIGYIRENNRLGTTGRLA